MPPDSSWARWLRPGADTWLGRRFGAARHPDVFDCAVRVDAGVLDGYGGRWRYRPSMVDQLVLDGVVTLYHGDGRGLRLRVDADSLGRGDAAARAGHLTFAATELGSGALLRLAADPGELARFGVGLA